MNNINHIKLIFIIIFFIFLSSISRSEIKIAIVEMDKVIKESSSGKSMIQQLAKLELAALFVFNFYNDVDNSGAK